MKKIIFALVAVITLGVTVWPESASAAWSGWQNRNGYSIRVYTDATTYTPRATSIDYKAEKKGSSRLYYKAILYKYTNSGLIHTGRVGSGSFTSSTPFKSFSVSSVRREYGTGTYLIKYNLYKNSNWTGYIGSANSNRFYITANI
ncbi:hypothetical protein ACX3X3_13545 [Bacillus subtilis]|uniref:hypothetical protein n=1 Tax=Bacillus subtilis TaxID=1423 RepID=UPI0011C7EB1F|nr:hypothetical protein [Bacillus subtilis]TXK63708.1 hypothetical protein FVD40_05015 [Bacillus subtilis]HEQ3553565.1 hypothetical protein [Enterococcus faecalis]